MSARGAGGAPECPKQVFELGALPRNHVGKDLDMSRILVT